jgi:hypothetical protein
MKIIRSAALLFGLVGLASMAHAALTSMSVANPTCSYTNFGFQNTGCASASGNLLEANLPADANGFQGVTFYLSGTDGNGFFQANAGALTDIEPSTSGGPTCFSNSCVTTISFGVSGASTGTGSLLSGSTIGLLGQFNLGIDTSQGGNGSFSGDGEANYTLSFNLVDNTQSNTGVFSGAQVLSGANAASNLIFQNALTQLTINAGDTLTLSETLIVNWHIISASGGLIVTIPQGSFDFDGVDTPEPSTFILLGPALAGAFLLRMRRKKT